jgi:gliding motility-associated-like protein
VQSFGAYPDTGLVNPIINRSQRNCGVPIDNEPPCVPVVNENHNCETEGDSLYWTINDSCAGDLETVALYYAIPGSDDFTLLETFSGSQTSFVFSENNSIAGCYYLILTDTAGNASDPTQRVCLGACPIYELPNIFTPDDNGINDLYHPILPYRDVKDIDLVIRNRWGAEVFSTTDPDINWNGKRNNDGEPVPDGVYFFRCIVNEFSQSVDESITPRLITGFIHVTRTQD